MPQYKDGLPCYSLSSDNTVKQHVSMIAAAKELGTTLYQVKTSLLSPSDSKYKVKVDGGYYIFADMPTCKFTEVVSKKRPSVGRPPVAVGVYSPDGKLLEQHRSKAECAQAYGISAQNFNYKFNKSLLYNGVVFAELGKFKGYNRNTGYGRSVLAIHRETGERREFKNTKEASNALHNKENADISHVHISLRSPNGWKKCCKWYFLWNADEAPSDLSGVIFASGQGSRYNR